MRNRAFTTTALAAVLGISAASQASAATPWTPVTVPVAAGYLNDVTGVGAVQWAVGATIDADGVSAPLLMSSGAGGAGWGTVPTPEDASAHAFYNNISAPSPRDVWISGGETDERTTDPVLHWDGKVWQTLDVTVPRNCASGLHIAAIAPNDVWAAGWYCEQQGAEDEWHPLLEHWNGTSWTSTPIPAAAGVSNLVAVTAVSADDVWATGFTSSDEPVALHYDGHSWKAVATPISGLYGELYSVKASGPDDVWAVGRVLDTEDDSGHALVMHWDGHTWRQVQAPADAGQLNAVTITGDGIVAIGRSADRTQSVAVRSQGGRLVTQTFPQIGGEAPDVYGIDAAGGCLTVVGGTEPDTGIPAPAVFTGRA